MDALTAKFLTSRLCSDVVGVIEAKLVGDFQKDHRRRFSNTLERINELLVDTACWRDGEHYHEDQQVMKMRADEYNKYVARCRSLKSRKPTGSNAPQKHHDGIWWMIEEYLRFYNRMKNPTKKQKYRFRRALKRIKAKAANPTEKCESMAYKTTLSPILCDAHAAVYIGPFFVENVIVKDAMARPNLLKLAVLDFITSELQLGRPVVIPQKNNIRPGYGLPL
jgi:hypothetical protein